MKDLKEYMFKHNLKLADIAQKLCCSYTYLSKVINGKLQAGERLTYKIQKLLEKKK